MTKSAIEKQGQIIFNEEIGNLWAIIAAKMLQSLFLVGEGCYNMVFLFTLYITYLLFIYDIYFIWDILLSILYICVVSIIYI